MDRIWSPWRYQFVTGKAPAAGCIFCQIRDNPEQDEQNLVVYRASSNFIILNLFPYTSGHFMIVPYEHVAALSEARDATTAEMMRLTRLGEQALQEAYHPGGINLGMNLGAAAGAGIAGHLHLHMLPRWFGDANFLSTIGETRVLPEELTATWRKLKSEFARLA